MKATTITAPRPRLGKVQIGFLLAICLGVALSASSVALAQGNSQRAQTQAADEGKRGNQQEALIVNIGFEEARRIAVANQLTGYADLPPGIRRNLARGKPLPPGLARKAVPGSMLGSLPVIGGHEWQIAGRDLVLVSQGTQLVVDILNNVFQ
jgi:hypothetical protein